MRVVLAFAGMAFGVAAAQAAPAVERPPQFVAIAFDNCTELERWREWSDFAAELNRGGERIRFTFFVSGINFLSNGKRHLYQGPNQARGVSRINFGGSAEDVRKRVAFMNALYRDGHEIASHAVGHFDGRGWGASAWTSEFNSFDDLMRNVGRNNDFPAEEGFAFSPKDVVGFRAPYLAHSPGLYTTLAARGFRYDTSGTMASHAWPEKRDGIWRFNLAGIRLAGSGRATLSMDYNFLVAQSGVAPIASRREEFRRQMLASYLTYFRGNYAGNRAPVHIGHHFTDYQNGAYREALKEFARRVCGLPEVRCVTYRTLADYMDQLKPEMLAAYRKGDFPRASEPVFAEVSTETSGAAR
ncbi:polysaccharide deacetylase [Pseudorhodoplanes sp.]|uniref:polysaccharide deacetylase n=1 Tax=Pseudorhodoplanes sp. TaxID=1934341 RepID=UPI00391B3E2C